MPPFGSLAHTELAIHKRLDQPCELKVYIARRDVVVSTSCSAVRGMKDSGGQRVEDGNTGGRGRGRTFSLLASDLSLQPVSHVCQTHRLAQSQL